MYCYITEEQRMNTNVTECKLRTHLMFRNYKLRTREQVHRPYRLAQIPCGICDVHSVLETLELMYITPPSKKEGY